MARFTRIQVATKMAETGMVPVFFHKDVETCKQVVLACYKAGVKVFEFTNRGDYAHETFTVLNKWAEKGKNRVSLCRKNRNLFVYNTRIPGK